MRAARGTIVAKSGAEGVHGLAHLPSGTGLVLKVVDGGRAERFHRRRWNSHGAPELARRSRVRRALESFAVVTRVQPRGARCRDSFAAAVSLERGGMTIRTASQRQVRALLARRARLRSRTPRISRPSSIDEVPGINWAGFYFADPQGDLVLGPFGGAPACTRLPHGRGVCGAALLRRETVVVDDVAAFADHIACDSASRSEIVVPFFDPARWPASSTSTASRSRRFGNADRAGIESLVAAFADASGYGGGGAPGGGPSGGGAPSAGGGPPGG